MTGKRTTPWLHIALFVYALTAAAGCAVTSPSWDYEPDSISAPIPFQAYATTTESPVIVECADDTSAHGWPSAGESSYVFAGQLDLSPTPMLDSQGAAVYNASKSLTLPNTCWKYFGSYGFWQANVRVSQMIDGTKRIFSSFDNGGLSCLATEIAGSGSWFGFIGNGCEKTYLGSSTQIPYIVLRMEGSADGVAKAMPAKAPLPIEDELDVDAPKVAPIEPLTADQLSRLQDAVRGGDVPSSVQDAVELQLPVVKSDALKGQLKALQLQ